MASFFNTHGNSSYKHLLYLIKTNSIKVFFFCDEIQSFIKDLFLYSFSFLIKLIKKF